MLTASNSSPGECIFAGRLFWWLNGVVDKPSDSLTNFVTSTSISLFKSPFGSEGVTEVPSISSTASSPCAASQTDPRFSAALAGSPKSTSGARQVFIPGETDRPASTHNSFPILFSTVIVSCGWVAPAIFTIPNGSSSDPPRAGAPPLNSPKSSSSLSLPPSSTSSRLVNPSFSSCGFTASFPGAPSLLRSRILSSDSLTLLSMDLVLPSTCSHVVISPSRCFLSF